MYTWNLSKFVFGKRVHAIIVCKNLESQKIWRQKIWSKQRWDLTWIWLTVTFNIQQVLYTHIRTIRLFIDWWSNCIERIASRNNLCVCHSIIVCLLACLRSFTSLSQSVFFSLFVVFCSSIGNLFKVTHSLPIKYVCAFYHLFSVTVPRLDERCHQIFIYWLVVMFLSHPENCSSWRLAFAYWARDYENISIGCIMCGNIGAQACQSVAHSLR